MLGVVLVSLLAGVAVGLVNGILGARVGLQPIVATLAVFVGGRGLAVVLSEGKLKDVRNADLIHLGSGDIAGLPMLAADVRGAERTDRIVRTMQRQGALAVLVVVAQTYLVRLRRVT